MADVTLYFDWNTFRPDQRQFRQRSVEMYPELVKVAIVIPLEHELVANSEDIIQIRLGSINAPEPDPILTLAGMKYVIDQFGLTFGEKKESKETVKDDEWGDEFDTGKEEKTEKASTSNDDEWENEGKESDDKAPWDESTDEWES